MLVNGTGGLKKPQPTHHCVRCEHDLSERAMILTSKWRSQETWECKNRNACDKRKASLTASRQVKVWITYNRNGVPTSEEYTAWTTPVPGLVAWNDTRHVENFGPTSFHWQLIHAPSGGFIDLFTSKQDAISMAEALGELGDWTVERPFDDRDFYTRAGVAVRQWHRKHDSEGTYEGVR